MKLTRREFVVGVAAAGIAGGVGGAFAASPITKPPAVYWTQGSASGLIQIMNGEHTTLVWHDMNRFEHGKFTGNYKSDSSDYYVQIVNDHINGVLGDECATRLDARHPHIMYGGLGKPAPQSWHDYVSDITFDDLKLYREFFRDIKHPATVPSRPALSGQERDGGGTYWVADRYKLELVSKVYKGLGWPDFHLDVLLDDRKIVNPASEYLRLGLKDKEGYSLTVIRRTKGFHA